MQKSTVPSVDLLTRRDDALYLLYNDYLARNLPPELAETKQRIEELTKRRSTIERDIWWRNDGCPEGFAPATTTEEDAETLPAILAEIKELESKLPDLEADHADTVGKALWLAAKREGFIAGIAQASIIFEQSDRAPHLMARLARALADDEFADRLAHEATKNAPDPYTSLEKYFPLDAQEQAAPAVASEGGAAE